MNTALSTGIAEQSDARTLRIREHNDAFRTTGLGEILLSHGLALRDDDFIAHAFRAVADYDDFNEGNDPHGEHDFGDFTVDGETLFFKIDYYDLKKEYHSDDPADPRKTRRVMTILLAEEY